jgi:hypothetical protein
MTHEPWGSVFTAFLTAASEKHGNDLVPGDGSGLDLLTTHQIGRNDVRGSGPLFTPLPGSAEPVPVRRNRLMLTRRSPWGDYGTRGSAATLMGPAPCTAADVDAGSHLSLRL